jgi:hypothetical protein
MRNKAVLVADAHALGMIGVVRSLGRAGYRVHAVSSQPDALGGRSSYAAVSTVHPPYSSPAFHDWLRTYVARERIEAIVPSEMFLHVVSDRYDEYRSLIPDAVPPEIWAQCMSKVSTQAALLAAGDDGQHLPRGGVVSTGAALPSREVVERIKGPYYLKADAGQAIAGLGSLVRRCEDAPALLQQLAELQPRYRQLLWQGFATGKKVGVSLWRHRGEILAESMTLGLHTEPHTGGMMTLRQTFWHEAILADAKQKIATLGWQGVAMMEYKWDPETDEFWFIEINARFWGYLHLDLFAGKDFPRLQLDGHFGRIQRDLGPPRREVTCRNAVTGEIGYLTSLLKDPAVPNARKALEIAKFLALFVNPRPCADLLFPGDRKLYWLAWGRFLRRWLVRA